MKTIIITEGQYRELLNEQTDYPERITNLITMVNKLKDIRYQIDVTKPSRTFTPNGYKVTIKILDKPVYDVWVPKRRYKYNFMSYRPTGGRWVTNINKVSVIMDLIKDKLVIGQNPQGEKNIINNIEAVKNGKSPQQYESEESKELDGLWKKFKTLINQKTHPHTLGDYSAKVNSLFETIMVTMFLCVNGNCDNKIKIRISFKDGEHLIEKNVPGTNYWDKIPTTLNDAMETWFHSPKEKPAKPEEKPAKPEEKPAKPLGDKIKTLPSTVNRKNYPGDNRWEYAEHGDKWYGRLKRQSERKTDNWYNLTDYYPSTGKRLSNHFG